MGTIYRGTDGRYYAESQLWERFESDAWTPFCWERETGREWVETAEDDLLALTPVTTEDLPRGVRIECASGHPVVRDDRDPADASDRERRSTERRIRDPDGGPVQDSDDV